MTPAELALVAILVVVIASFGTRLNVGILAVALAWPIAIYGAGWKAEQLMQSLRIEWESERAAYYSDEEYAAALLGLTVDDLVRQYGS